jgi:diguanylate cyclase (GGDEF)-like protein
MTAQTESHSADFFFSILDSIDVEVAAIQKNGLILYVNDAWVKFGGANGMGKENWLRSNYLNVCAIADKVGEPEVHEIYEGISAVVSGQAKSFFHEYPCHSPIERRWFMMNIVGMVGYENEIFVITHSNITQRKLIEEQVELLSLIDPLTGLSNRRHFENFLLSEWHRNQREQTSISLIMIDIDYFKALNDNYGHLIGDKCLKAVASIISQFARRPSDLAVRWGGEEFILVMGNTTSESVFEIASQIRLAVEMLNSSEFGRCTVSAGVSSIIPDDEDHYRLIKEADAALYMAKESGRNKLAVFNPIGRV